MWTYLILLVVAVSAEKVRYDGYQMISAGPVSTSRAARYLMSLESEKVILQQDTVTTRSAVELLVAPEEVERVKTVLTRHGIDYTVIMQDYQKYMDHLLADNERLRKEYIARHQANPDMFQAPDYYPPWNDVKVWMNDMAARANANGVSAQVTQIGSTFAGNEILALTFNADQSGRPAAYMDAVHHAREWLTVPTLMHTAVQVAIGTSSDDQEMRDGWRWYFVFVVNTDGYVYTFETNSNWRKNRRNNIGNACYGVDLNRNYAHQYAVCGTSTNPCSDTYRGTGAFSEPETAVVRDYINGISNMQWAISMHSYGQYWLTPGGCYGGGTGVPDYGTHIATGTSIAAAISSVNGRNFAVGSPVDVLYGAGGGTHDWIYSVAGVLHSYTPELRGNTFQPPLSNIWPSQEEIYAGICQGMLRT